LGDRGDSMMAVVVGTVRISLPTTRGKEVIPPTRCYGIIGQRSSPLPRQRGFQPFIRSASMQTTAALSRTGPMFRTTSARQQVMSIGFYEVINLVIFPSMHPRKLTLSSIFGPCQSPLCLDPT